MRTVDLADVVQAVGPLYARGRPQPGEPRVPELQPPNPPTDDPEEDVLRYRRWLMACIEGKVPPGAEAAPQAAMDRGREVRAQLREMLQRDAVLASLGRELLVGYVGPSGQRYADVVVGALRWLRANPGRLAP